MKNKRLVRQIIFGGSVWILLTFIFLFPLTRNLGDSFDFVLFSLQEKDPQEDIVIVGLDDKTLNNEDFKRYQDISRADYARVIEHIAKGNPKAIGVDIFFFNKSENSEEDDRLAEVLKRYDNIVLVEEFDESLENPSFTTPYHGLGIGAYDKGYADLGSHLSDGSLVTQVNMILDQKRGAEDDLHEPFAMKVFRKLYPGSQGAHYNSSNSIYNMIMGSVSWRVPLQKTWSIPINFYGGSGSYKEYSFYQVWDSFDDRVPFVESDVFEDKVVFIGATAKDIHDFHPTPTARFKEMSGVEIHAHLFQTIATRDYLYYSSGFLKWCLMSLFVLGTFAMVWLFSLKRSLIILSGSSLILLIFVLQVFIYKNALYTYFWPLLGGWLMYLVLHIEKYLFAEQEKSWIKEAFGKYLSPLVVQKLVDHPEDISLDGESRDITLWFSDIVGFTSLSEKLDSQQAVALLNTYHQQAASLLMEQSATIDKYLGDGTMAFWGAPLPIEDHAVKACLTSLLHRDCLTRANEKLREQGLPEIGVCIGLHTASVSVGNIGTHSRMEYTAIGSGVNLASRVEGLNRIYGTRVIISEFTYERAKNQIFVRELDLVKVKGSDRPMTIYELVAMAGDATVDMEYKKQIYEEGLFAYRSGYWGTAKAHFYKLKNDKAAEMMAERCEYFEKNDPGKDWGGVWTMTSK